MNHSWKTSFVILIAMVLSTEGRGQDSMPQASSSSPQGVLSPWRTCRVACAESGLVEEILVKPGDAVSRGQLLGRLEANHQQISIAIAHAQASAVGRLQSAQAELDLQTRRLQSVANARPRGYTSQSELERAEVELEISRGRLLAEEEEQAVQRLQVKRLEYQLEQRSVIAPFSGIVVKILKEVGEYVAPNTPEVVELVDTSRLRAVFYLNLHEVEALSKMGKPVVEIDERQFTETELEFISPVADPESGLVEVRVLVLNPSKKVMGASCTLLLGQPSGRTT